MDEKDKLLMVKQYGQQIHEQFLRPNLTFLNSYLDRVLYAFQSKQPNVQFSDKVLWGVYVSVDESVLKANVSSFIERFFKLRNVDYLIGHSGVSVGAVKPGRSAVQIGIKIGNVQQSMDLTQFEYVLLEPIQNALFEIIDRWFIGGIIRTLIKLAHQGKLKPENWSTAVNQLGQVISSHLSEILTHSYYIVQNIEDIPEIESVVDEFVEMVFERIPPGSPEFGEVLDELSDMIAHSYERTFRRRMTEREKISVKNSLSNIKHTWEEMVTYREGYEQGGLVSSIQALFAGLKIARQPRGEGFGVWDLMKTKTKEAIFKLFGKKETFNLESIVRGLVTDVVEKYLRAPYVYLDTVVGPNLGFGQQAGGQPPQAPQIQPPKSPPKPPPGQLPQPRQLPRGPIGPSAGGKRVPRIFYIKQIKTKDPKKVKPITKLPPLSEVVYRILLWWKNLSERDKAVLSSILRRYLTETDDNVRKELERELVSVAKGLGIPVKFKEKKTD